MGKLYCGIDLHSKKSFFCCAEQKRRDTGAYRDNDKTNRNIRIAF